MENVPMQRASSFRTVLAAVVLFAAGVASSG
jgi:hypothetical protein